jgi:general secretion pathway protein D
MAGSLHVVLWMGPLRGQKMATDGSVGQDRFLTIARRRVALNQGIKNQKRRWLAALISVAKPNAAWILPALISPVMVSGMLGNSVAQNPPAQTTSVAQPLAASAPLLTPELVMSKLDVAMEKASSNDLKAAASAFAEALRGRSKLASKDARVEARLAEIDVALRNKGITKQQVIDALATLSPLPANPAPDVAKSEPSAGLQPLPTAMPQLPPVLPAYSISDAGKDPVQPGVFVPATDRTRTQPAAAAVQVASESTIPMPIQRGGAGGDELYRRGIEALSQGQTKEAYELFQEAWKFQGEMDPLLRNQLRDKLTVMSANSRANESGAVDQRSPEEQQQLAANQRMISEVTGEIHAAEANREAEPEVVAERLQALRIRVSQADLDGATRKQLLTLVDRSITAHQIYMTQNKAAINQNMINRQVTEKLALDDETRYKTEQQVASLVETYQDLMDKGDYAEAEVVAKQVAAIDPNSTISRLLIANSRNARRNAEYELLRAQKEVGFIDSLNDVDRSAIPMSDENPLLFPDAKTWSETSKKRLRQTADARRGMSAAEAQIWDKLKQPILVDFKARPLTEVVQTLSEMTGISIHVDTQGLAMEGFTSEMPITLSLPSAITLRSALVLMLNSQNLDFVVANEVLTITSARNGAQAIREQVYNVRDLVLPIPNFVTDYNSGLGGALRNAYESMGRGLVVQSGPVPGALAAGTQLASASMDPNAGVLGQLNNQMPNIPGLPNGIPPQALLWGRQGMGNGPTYGAGNMGAIPMQTVGPQPLQGGAVIADFDTLMNLIQQTIAPDSWLANGGTSTITPYPANLSIVVSAPQTTHEKIVDLLESLRELQDLQVTIEVKFITLTDNFFERIGVDFDVKVDDNVRSIPNEDQGPSTVVGISTNLGNDGVPVFNTDLDLRLSQNSFGAVPPFGVFDPEAGASLGVAILSDLEMFFFMNAAQGDSRSNILQAPRVTMFDGQTASISDNVQTPFVTSLIPVVGDFAVAQQPVVVVLNEGTTLNVQAVVSPDKRFVRVTLNPTFSRINSVSTFTFDGTTTTRRSTSRSGNNVLDPDEGEVDDDDEEVETVRTGTTIQQPSFAQTTISTTVSVPDGGTILLGGIKRMREGRVERGVPILSKIPYVNRLFRNTAIGRETSTLMMTVTPRIIIQEEAEESILGVAP